MSRILFYVAIGITSGMAAIGGGELGGGLGEGWTNGVDGEDWEKMGGSRS